MVTKPTAKAMHFGINQVGTALVRKAAFEVRFHPALKHEINLCF
jgi:hypothetical protein